MTDNHHVTRLKSAAYAAIVLVLIGALGTCVEVIRAPRGVMGLLRDEPLSFFAPLTLLVFGFGTLIAVAAARKNSALASAVTRGLLVIGVLYGAVATAVLLRSVLPFQSFFAGAFALGVTLTFIAWVVVCVVLTRYLRKIVHSA